ncbi:hypothetical protein PTSG_13214 [Salpingoeca rosetta]|uniref:Uncharacterized protein n=1 Tax=Salpingoeca rosetta (strain ATCC 50818 / BSB-021) TaxID=946362 RepID=F2UTK0_SALR5|nr:uncharacterized protein PTSG_13214 [Salpingoeca rosetta]EGD72973.1 hypothetical protein PTSG_13214 [Salpingoeca rosetta]|eukprot:XP_004987506.1 hypothetical protein PTSG_13214 [Salpingoeca rosetta]
MRRRFILRIDLRQGSVIATVASLNEDITVCLFSLFVSGDITVMGFTASKCEADAFLDDSSLWLHGKLLKALDAVGCWDTTALLEETPAVLMVVVDHRQCSVAVCHAVFDDALLLLSLRWLFVDTHAYIGTEPRHEETTTALTRAHSAVVVCTVSRGWPVS